MLNYGKKIRALRDKNYKYSFSCVVRKKILNEKKKKKNIPLCKLNGRSLTSYNNISRTSDGFLKKFTRH